ncbi:sensor histidine kinase [Lichenibacterium dinghuense]|uniref:sensor histidine kinase n=1 Tax=Lichenibacterium dinghuense TaxID=2895977 RepID=UPI001F417EE3|nr:HAMP domain-containing sensor histidine kinase [Lichenibacterium sp. 6Y81]
MTIVGKLFRTTAFRLSLAYLVIFAVGAGVVLGGIDWDVNQLLDGQIGQTIQAETNGLAEQYDTGGIRQLITAVERRTEQPGASLYLVTNYAGEPLAGNVAALPPGVIDHPGLIEITYERHSERRASHLALAQVLLLPSGFRLLVGRDLEERENLRDVMIHALFTSLFWVMLVGLVGGLVMSFRILRRVDAMNASARTIMEGDLSRRLPLGGTGDELDRLAANLNAMIARIAGLMTGLREVSDNIAHDLRTPLTRLRNGAEEALRADCDADRQRAALEKVIAEADGLIAVFNALLMIARAEAGAGRDSLTEGDAGAVVADVAELYEPSAEEEGVRFSAEVDPGLAVLLNRELLGQGVANLIDNALKYGTAEEGGASEVAVSARRAGDRVEIAVADRGRGIPAADRARVLDRFVRLEGSRSLPGSGLGLSLAAAIARLHGGELHLSDNGPGLRAVMSLPAAARKAEPPRAAQPALLEHGGPP